MKFEEMQTLPYLKMLSVGTQTEESVKSTNDLKQKTFSTKGTDTEISAVSNNRFLSWLFNKAFNVCVKEKDGTFVRENWSPKNVDRQQTTTHEEHGKEISDMSGSDEEDTSGSKDAVTDDLQRHFIGCMFRNNRSKDSEINFASGFVKTENEKVDSVKNTFLVQNSEIGSAACGKLAKHSKFALCNFIPQINCNTKAVLQAKINNKNEVSIEEAWNLKNDREQKPTDGMEIPHNFGSDDRRINSASVYVKIENEGVAWDNSGSQTEDGATDEEYCKKISDKSGSDEDDSSGSTDAVADELKICTSDSNRSLQEKSECRLDENNNNHVSDEGMETTQGQDLREIKSGGTNNVRVTKTKGRSRRATKRKETTCTYCKKTLKRNELTRHLRTHTGEKLYKCTVCEKAFTQNSTLNSHLLIHSGEKPFECTFCDKVFSQKGSLNRHLRSHYGKKPFKCEICYKAFTRKFSQESHMLIHSGEKPYKCTMCHKKFRHKGNFVAHKIKAHS